MRREAYQPHIENKFCFEKKWILCITEAKKTPEFLNQCSDFHLGRHFFGLVGGFIVGLFVTCSFMAIIWLLNMVFSDGIDDWKGEIIKGSLYTVTIIIFNNWKEIKEHIWKL